MRRGIKVSTVKIGNVILLSEWMKLYIFECWNNKETENGKRWYNWWKKFIGDDSSDEFLLMYFGNFGIVLLMVINKKEIDFWMIIFFDKIENIYLY